MTTRIPLVLNGTTVEELQTGDDLNPIPTVAATTAEMQAGTVTDPRSMTPKDVKDAIMAQASPISGVNLRVFDTSGTFTPTVTGYYEVYVSGGGGSGCAFNDGGLGPPGCGTGGGAGGFAIKKILLTAGIAYTCTVGAGGASVSRTTRGATSGNTGGASSFSGSGITTITANGGSGGLGNVTGAIVAGGAGGTATGGDFNYTGGDGGSITVAQGVSGFTGGGAVAIRGVSYRGGNITVNASSGASTGGAGVGGNGGDVTLAATTVTGGGGNNAACANNAVTAMNTICDAVLPMPFNYFFRANGLLSTVNAGAGFGGVNSTTAPGEYGGASAVAVPGLAGGKGGGGGAPSSTSGTSVSGAGGNGRIIIMW